MSMIGVIMLMGLVTKNAILLVDFANQARARGVDRDAALIDAGQIRLRPIVMTTLAMIFGMLPLALALGAGAEFRAPMARAVIGGLITSTLLTLIVVPVVYTFLDDFGPRRRASGPRGAARPGRPKRRARRHGPRRGRRRPRLSGAAAGEQPQARAVQEAAVEHDVPHEPGCRQQHPARRRGESARSTPRLLRPSQLLRRGAGRRAAQRPRRLRRAPPGSSGPRAVPRRSPAGCPHRSRRRRARPRRP